jgi:hypothetical protein
MGKIELDHTGSGGGVTLSSDGTDLLLDGTAIGGGGGSPDLFAENYDGTSTLPSATGTNALALQDGAVASANRSIAVGQDAVSSGIYAVALGVSTDAINFFGTALGYKAQTASSDGATALTNSRASGSYSFAAAIANNTSSYGATGSNSVAIGHQSKASSSYAVAIGGFSCTASNIGAVVLGYSSEATNVTSVAIGANASSKIRGKLAIGSGRFSSTGDAQTGVFTLRSDTTDATPEALTTNNGTAGTSNQIILSNNSAYAFHGTIVARQQASGGTACAAWKVEGLIRREGSAGTTVLVNSATTVLDNTPSWGLALSADTTNGGLKVEATGAASTNIRWVATIHTSEVTYA